MLVWWESLGILGQVFACIAIPATLILLIQTVLLFLGIGGEADSDADGDGGEPLDGIFGDDLPAEAPQDGPAETGLRLFTFRGMIAFFAVMGWTGIVCVKSGLHLSLSVGLSLVAGALALIGVAFLLKLVLSLQYDGTENVRNALGAGGTVYLRIPPCRTGRGKVNLLIQGAWTEKYAVTDEETELGYGEEVVVVGVSGGTTLIVKRQNT